MIFFIQTEKNYGASLQSRRQIPKIKIVGLPTCALKMNSKSNFFAPLRLTKFRKSKIVHYFSKFVHFIRFKFIIILHKNLTK